MNAIVTQSRMVGHFSEFFAPIAPDLIASLVKQYLKKKALIERLHETMQKPDIVNAMSYFIEASKRKNNDRGMSTFEVNYDLEKATAGLDSEFWQKALNLTDVYEHMPQKRRTEWSDMIRECTCVAFEEQTVYDTIESLLNSRSQFFAERVDGMFKSLSGEHVTNSPSGFNKRMIVAGAIDHLDLVRWEVAGTLDDLRKVIAKFLGNQESGFGDSRGNLEQMKRCYGEWVEWDGGALRAKLFKKGTVHLEVHPDVAWKLNEILAHLYPRAISSSSLKKPTRPSRVFNHIKRPIPGRVLNALQEAVKHHSGGMKIEIPWRLDKELTELVMEIFKSIGGVEDTYKYKFDRWESKERIGKAVKFDYFPNEVIAKIICSGVLPDQKSFQYYPTPPSLAEEAAEWCEIEGSHKVLEPSAGQGGLASHISSKDLTCVEVSDLHCEVLKSKHLNAVLADFLDWAPKHEHEFDRVLMNPPFSEGRAIRHVEAAARCLKKGGQLVAILPSSFKDKPFLDGFEVEYSDVKENLFADASVNVVMMKVIRTSH